MSKDFEEEYRRYQSQNAPDLWSRIEAGIDSQQEESKTSAKKVISFPIRRTAAIAAACIAVIICIPSLRIWMRGSSQPSNMTMEEAADCVPQEEMNFEMAESDCAAEVQIGIYRVKVMEVDITEEIVYTVLVLPAEEEATVVELAGEPSLEEGKEYEVSLIGTEEGIYYLEEIVVE